MKAPFKTLDRIDAWFDGMKPNGFKFAVTCVVILVLCLFATVGESLVALWKVLWK